jgi:general secretion pathway protein C
MANVDALARRYYPGIVLGLVGLVAYLQGGGIASLVAEQLPAPAGAAPGALAAAPHPAGQADKTATPILARNAFDSQTGPLVGKPPKPPPTPAPTADVGPRGHPKCTTGDVVLITESEDPAFSFALIKTSGPAKMRRVGDDVDGKKIETISWDHVVLASGATRCQLMMHDEVAAKAEPPAAGAAGRGAAKPEKSAGAAPGLDITKVSDTEFVIERSGSEKMTQMQQAFMKAGRVVDGQGVRVQRSAATTILNQLGFQKDDMVKTINGFDMTNPDQAMQAYAQVKTAKKVQVQLERQGKPVTLDFTIK